MSERQTIYISRNRNLVNPRMDRLERTEECNKRGRKMFESDDLRGE